VKINPEEIKGTDVNYYFICTRRAWMSVHDFYIIDKNEFIQHGTYLSDKKRRYGFREVKIGKNKIDNLEMLDDGCYVVHEFKRGRKPLPGDIFQTLHYINILENRGYEIKYGLLHLLGTKVVKTVYRTNDNIEKLYNVYNELFNLKNMEMPEPVKNYFCIHGCSYSFFCWS
jgi:CRISPR-associated exonuclease Cas4